MPLYRVRVIEQTIHYFTVKADDEGQIADGDVDELFADLCSSNDGFFAVERRDIDEIEEADDQDDDPDVDMADFITDDTTTTDL
jgi:hypothetical protein